MKTSEHLNGCDVNSIYPDNETAAALECLEAHEAHFVLQKVREAIPAHLADELQSWYELELSSPVCDMEKVARMATACRALRAIRERMER